MKKGTALAVQGASALALSVLTYAIKPLRPLHLAAKWGILPLWGAVSAYFVSERGVNGYLAWPIPGICHALGAYLVSLGYLPGAGAVLLTLLTGIIGAAASETRRKLLQKRYRKTHRKVHS